MSADYFDAGFLALKDEVMKVVTPAEAALGITPKDQPPPKHPVTIARRIQSGAGAITAALGLPLQLLNDGFALMTSGISALLPPFPAATLGSAYMGPPHAHTHPPSLIPPAPPVPLPSIGAILLGTSIKVLINGLPAARCGDIGLAITCCGLIPMFEVKTGSSKVFIGGNRAARAIDFCLECAPSSSGMNGLAIASFGLGALASVAGIVADVEERGESLADGDPAMAAAKALDAAMSAAALAMDVATMAIKATLGKDPGVPPAEGLIVMGSPTVLIGGFPCPAFPDPMQKLFEKLKAKFAKKPAAAKNEEAEEGPEACAIE